MSRGNQLRNSSTGSPRVQLPRRQHDGTREKARGHRPAESSARGAYGKGGPVTWENLCFLGKQVDQRQGKTGAETLMESQGVNEYRESEGRIGAMKVGNELALGPSGAKAARVDTNFWREPWRMHRHRKTCHRNYRR